MGLARNLNLLALGEEVAVGLGSNIQMTRLVTGITIVLLAGTCVAIVYLLALLVFLFLT